MLSVFEVVIADWISLQGMDRLVSRDKQSSDKKKQLSDEKCKVFDSWKIRIDDFMKLKEGLTNTVIFQPWEDKGLIYASTLKTNGILFK